MPSIFSAKKKQPQKITKKKTKKKTKQKVSKKSGGLTLVICCLKLLFLWTREPQRHPKNINFALPY